MECWKPVFGWEDSHEVSNLGQVRSIKRKGSKNMVLKLQMTEGYPSTALVAFGKRKWVYVHHLVALAFHGQPPSAIGTHQGGYTVNHKDFDRCNNQPENLEWLTTKENTLHAFEGNRVPIRIGNQIKNTKLDEARVKEIKILLAKGESSQAIANKFGVVNGTIHAIEKGRTWKYVS